MLVLSRYRDESIYVGDDVIITVVDIRGDRVRIGIQAPPNVAVHRQEVYEAIKNEKQGVPLRMEKEQTPTVPVTPKPASAPLSQELSKRKAKIGAEAKALPISVDSSMELGELTDIIPK